MGVSLKDVVETGVGIASTAMDIISKDKSLQKTLFGTYTNGKPRSVADAFHGEIIHPQDRLLIDKRIQKNKKKKKKKESEGKKYGKIDLDD